MTRKTKILTTKNIAFAAVLSALCIVVNYLPAAGAYKLTFSYTVCFVAGHFFGPIVGAIVGVFGDAMGCLAKGYAPNPLLSVGSILLGLLPGVIQYLSRLFRIKNKTVYGVVWTIVSFVVVFVIVTVFWNTYALWLMFGQGKKTYWAYMAGRIGLQTIVWAVNLALSIFIYPILARVLHFAPTTIWDYVKLVKDKSDIPQEPQDLDEATQKQA